MNYCKDCRWYTKFKSSSEPKCCHPCLGYTEEDPITGPQRVLRNCKLMRGEYPASKCGPEGKVFEAKRWWHRLMGL